MSASRTPLVVAALLLLAVPAGAGTPVLVEDPCGDVSAVLAVDPGVSGTGIRVEPTDVVALEGARADAFDVEAVRVRDLVEGDAVVGVEVVLELCGDLPAPGPTPSRWAVQWDLPARQGATSCVGEVRVTDAPSVGAPTGVRGAHLSEICTSDGGLLGGSTTAGEYDVPLEDWEVVGSTVRWRLDASAVAPAASGQLLTGTPWDAVHADARDGNQLTRTALTSGGRDVVRASGPGVEDSTARGGGFVVG